MRNCKVAEAELTSGMLLRRPNQLEEATPLAFGQTTWYVYALAHHEQVQPYNQWYLLTFHAQYVQEPCVDDDPHV